MIIIIISSSRSSSSPGSLLISLTIWVAPLTLNSNHTWCVIHQGSIVPLSSWICLCFQQTPFISICQSSSVCLFVCLSVCVLTKCKPFQFAIHRQPSSFNICTASTALPKILSIKNKKSGFAKSSQTKFTKSMSTSNLQSSLHQKGGFLCFQSPAWSHSCPKEKRDFCRNLHGDSVAAGAKLVQQDVSFKSGEYGNS